MTDALKNADQPPRDAMASTSRDLELDLLGLRLNGAQLGTMLSVSRQAVSRAVQYGKIRPPGPDGLFDAKRAVREWMENSNPARMRARALRPGAEAITELRDRAQRLFAENAQLRDDLALEREWGDEREAAARLAAADRAAEQLDAFTTALKARFSEARAAETAGRLSTWVDELAAVAYYGVDLDEYRRDFPDEEAIDAGGIEPHRTPPDEPCPELPTNSGQTRDAESLAPIDCPECPECPE